MHIKQLLIFPIGIFCTSLLINTGKTFYKRLPFITIVNTGQQVNAFYKYQELTVYFSCLPFLVRTKPFLLLGIRALGNSGRHISQEQQKKLHTVHFLM